MTFRAPFLPDFPLIIQTTFFSTFFSGSLLYFYLPNCRVQNSMTWSSFLNISVIWSHGIIQSTSNNPQMYLFSPEFSLDSPELFPDSLLHIPLQRPADLCNLTYSRVALNISYKLSLSPEICIACILTFVWVPYGCSDQLPHI